MTTQYQLTMQSGPTPGKVFPLEGNTVTIGREPDNGVVIPDPEVSRKHTKLALENDQYVISDMGSTNGTVVDGQRVTTEHVMVSGEVISLSENISLLFEAIAPAFKPDPNATIMSPARVAPVAPASMPAPTPEPEPTPMAADPVYTPAPTPAPMPAPSPVPAPMPAAKAPAKAGGNSKTAMIIAGVVLLCLVCCCLSGAGYYVYTNHMFGL